MGRQTNPLVILQIIKSYKFSHKKVHCIWDKAVYDSTRKLDQIRGVY